MKTLFAADLEQQGVGTFADIGNRKYDALLPVPSWSWASRETEVARILASQSSKNSIKFAWPLLKDILGHCQCVISGAAIEIEPYIAPLSAFGSYSNAVHRVFMSATVTDDSFLVKGLQLKPATITNPLTFAKETWSGEKMVLIPSLMHEDLDRERMVSGFAKPNAKRNYGVVALAPSFARTKDWQAYGAFVANKDTVGDAVEALKKNEFEKTIVLANRYDGIDLPDDTCRILVFDSKPYSESLIDLYQEYCRPKSKATLMRTVRSVEQGMGRSVRGEKDYSVIVVIGPDLVRLIRERSSRKYLSSQMATQIEIGLEIVGMAQQEIEGGKAPADALNGLLRQSLNRDSDWKAFYVEQMDKVVPSGANPEILKVYAAELAAEQAYTAGDYSTGSEKLQEILDGGTIDPSDKGWYLQERARYHYISDRTESQKLQVAAHRSNRLLLKPPTGVTVTKLTVVSHGRTERVAKWIGGFKTYAT